MKRRLRILAAVTGLEVLALAVWLTIVNRQLARSASTTPVYQGGHT